MANNKRNAPQRHSGASRTHRATHLRNLGLEARLDAVEHRNQRVERDKAWETSLTRRLTISIITYITACFILYMILIPDWYLGAIIPVCGFWLSTLSLPIVRNWWQKG